MENKFYINTEAIDYEAYKLAMKFACELAKKDNDVRKIILYINSKQDTGMFDTLFNSDTVKRLFKGAMFKDCHVIYKFETKITYKKALYGNGSDVVICCGTTADDILQLDDYHSAKYIIAIPWLMKYTEKWINTWNAIEISGKEKTEVTQYPEPTPIVKTAMKELTSCINMSTGITHHYDKDQAKTYIKSLHKYEPELSADIVGAYLVRELNWDTKHAKDVENLINILNEGRFFQGGEKTGLQNYYKRWKEECK